MPTAIVRIATGEFLDTGGVPDGVTLAKVTVSRNPDARRERWNGADIVSKSQAKIDAYDTGQLDTMAVARSLDRDTIATIAFIIRQSDPTAWNAMTGAQRKQAVKTGAQQWAQMRAFFDKGV